MSEVSSSGEGMDVGTDDVSDGVQDTGNVTSEVTTSANDVAEDNYGKGVETFSFAENTSRGTETSAGSHNFDVSHSMEDAQRSVESFHVQSIEQILSSNGKYMTEANRERVGKGADSVTAVEHSETRGHTGAYMFSHGKSNIEVSAQNTAQMERSTKHETNHFASNNREIIVPDPENKGYTVYKTVGTRQTSWFHSNETGKDSDFKSKGQGLNEGLTTMYTNQQLSELSPEKGTEAERQGIYPYSTEVCQQLEEILGKDTLKEAYYGGNINGLSEKVDSLAGEKGYESLCECLDRTLSKDPGERVQAMKDAQAILERMYEKEGGEQ